MGLKCLNKCLRMSKKSYIRNHGIQYIIQYSFLRKGERVRFNRICHSKRLQESFEEVKENILQSKREDFEMRPVGIVFS